VAAGRPVAVLFDEQNDIGRSLSHFGRNASFKLDEAYSGGRCLKVEADRRTDPVYVRPFGHRIPNWDVPIAENPKPGEYRWLQFAWRALSHGTKGMTLRVAPAHFGGLALHAGTYTKCQGAKAKRVANAPPAKWTLVRVDLWKELGKPLRIGGLSLGCAGGPAAFDQILLGRTEADLKAHRPARIVE